MTFREAMGDPVRMRLALVPRLALMPAPAGRLRLAVEHFGPPAGDQRGLLAPMLMQEPAADLQTFMPVEYMPTFPPDS